ncbi:hypothetical protein KIL84_001686 [Mauremys mutica]|uniref:Uncharacterized protein n=1 Tax=Mauremys mutica TaxID=74926 RepID=A0A9D3XJD8_9SAUR|nr:hypothetical protein KIL84_001686 [Mauremys mutica]
MPIFKKQKNQKNPPFPAVLYSKLDGEKFVNLWNCPQHDFSTGARSEILQLYNRTILGCPFNKDDGQTGFDLQGTQAAASLQFLSPVLTPKYSSRGLFLGPRLNNGAPLEVFGRLPYPGKLGKGFCSSHVTPPSPFMSGTDLCFTPVTTEQRACTIPLSPSRTGVRPRGQPGPRGDGLGRSLDSMGISSPTQWAKMGWVLSPPDTTQREIDAAGVPGKISWAKHQWQGRVYLDHSFLSPGSRPASLSLGQDGKGSQTPKLLFTSCCNVRLWCSPKSKTNGSRAAAALFVLNPFGTSYCRKEELDS